MSFRATETDSRREPKTAAVRVRSGVLVLDAEGHWAIDTDTRTNADGYFVEDSGGELAIDDAATEGQAVRLMPDTAITY